ncbi:RNA-binding protein [Candidatus Poribacteria bacterium]|nr:RNA-binding protein [Candidatus Poribacteria bacterium]
MRLDKFLQISRIIKRRILANEICNRGNVTVNGQIAKAGKKISLGDRLDIDLGENEILSYEILEVPSHNVPKSKATFCYRKISTS